MIEYQPRKADNPNPNLDANTNTNTNTNIDPNANPNSDLGVLALSRRFASVGVKTDGVGQVHCRKVFNMGVQQSLDLASSPRSIKLQAACFRQYSECMPSWLNSVVCMCASTGVRRLRGRRMYSTGGRILKMQSCTCCRSGYARGLFPDRAASRCHSRQLAGHVSNPLH